MTKRRMKMWSYRWRRAQEELVKTFCDEQQMSENYIRRRFKEESKCTYMQEQYNSMEQRPISGRGRRAHRVQNSIRIGMTESKKTEPEVTGSVEDVQICITARITLLVARRKECEKDMWSCITVWKSMMVQA